MLVGCGAVMSTQANDKVRSYLGEFFISLYFSSFISQKYPIYVQKKARIDNSMAFPRWDPISSFMTKVMCWHLSELSVVFLHLYHKTIMFICRTNTHIDDSMGFPR